eukprot:TRINITY_DN68251_c0_g1_i1.p1 TRINITY_DN68251_c0_g1~~TRINITY_DN68251_c0_g1_i1.p1  ORF type:complete len:439 (-),score=83.52 TRINITY_DN68251_c0_g1_i1:110-1426(-)
MSDKIKLYGVFPAFLSLDRPLRARHFRPQWVMEELGQGYDLITVDLLGGQRNPTNPLGEIPSIVDGDFTLTESCAISSYLAKKAGGLYPFKSLQEESHCQQMALFAASTLENTVFKIVFNDPKVAPFGADKCDKNQYDSAMTAWKNKVAPALAVFLGDKSYFEGDFSVVDVFIAYPLMFAKELGLVNEKDTPKLAAYMSRIEARPAYQKSQAYRPRPKLYGFHPPGIPAEDRGGRPRSHRVLWAAQELGVALEWISINPTNGENQTAEYKALNPTGEIPTLVDGETVLTESIAITNYLGEKFGTKSGLYPTSAAQKALLNKISFFVASTGEGALVGGMFANSEHFKVPVPKDPAKYEAGKKTWESKVAPTLKAWLGDKLYMLGDTFTIADVTVGYMLQFAQICGVLGDQPELAAYLARVTNDRAAFAAAWSGPEACGC